MKTNYFFFPLLLLACAVPFSTTAQKFEGKITYAIEYDELPEGMEQFAAMMPSESFTYIKGKMARNEQVTGMGTQVAINDSKNKSFTYLMDMMGQKIKVTLSHEEMEKQSGKKTEPKITYENETKEIAGYSCQKALVSFDDQGEPIAVWFTSELPAEMSDRFRYLKGFPLEYELRNAGVAMAISAKSVSQEAVSDELFTVPKGYQEMEPASFGGMMQFGN